jgi:hypothetical protein
MIATFVMVAALTASGYDPAPEVHKIPGPAFQIPCKVDQPKEIDRVQLYVSDNRGKTWALYQEITPNEDSFTFYARKPGEYWFTARLKKKDGTLVPTDQAKFVVMQRVAVETGTGYGEPASPLPSVKPIATATEIAKELDDELTRVEMELIRKEIKRLAEVKKFTPETGDKIDRLRMRLRDVQAHIRRNRDDSPLATQSNPPAVYPPSPYIPPPAATDDRIPPTTTPTIPSVIPKS